LTVVSAVVYSNYSAGLIAPSGPKLQRLPRISEYAEEKRTEQNSMYTQSEAEVTNNRRLRSTYCTIEAKY